MKLLVLTSTFPRWQNDTEPRFVFELCEHLSGKGISIDVIAPHTEGSRQVENFEDITIYRYRYFSPKYEKLAYAGGINANLKKYWYAWFLVPCLLISQCCAIYKRLKQEKYDLVHAHWIIPQAFCCLLVFKLFRFLKIPLLCTAHGSDLYTHNSGLVSILKKYTLKNLDHISVVSHAMKQDLLNLDQDFDDKKISVLSMGVDLQTVFKPDESIFRNPGSILYVGRLTVEKGVDLLINALSLIISDYPDIRLDIVGDGPDRSRLETLASRLQLKKNIVFHGGKSRMELPTLYSAAAIFVNPSLREGFGLVTVEAMGCECAVIASALPAMTDIVQHNDNGLLFEPDNQEDLAGKIRFLLQHPETCTSLAKRGRQVALTQFDWDIISDKYYQLIKKI